MRPEEEIQVIYIGQYTDWYRNGMNVLKPHPSLKSGYNMEWKYKYLMRLKKHDNLAAHLAIL
jgi:hypothetical protein